MLVPNLDFPEIRGPISLPQLSFGGWPRPMDSMDTWSKPSQTAFAGWRSSWLTLTWPIPVWASPPGFQLGKTTSTEFHDDTSWYFSSKQSLKHIYVEYTIVKIIFHQNWLHVINSSSIINTSMKKISKHIEYNIPIDLLISHGFWWQTIHTFWGSLTATS